MTLADDDLITLKDASEVIFKGRVSPETLKDQWRKGNLDLSKIGRSYFATVADFRGLKTKCPASHGLRQALEKIRDMSAVIGSDRGNSEIHAIATAALLPAGASIPPPHRETP